MAEERTYQGATYRRGGPGEPWVLVPQPGPVAVGQGDPNRGVQSQADAQRAVAEASSASAEAPYAGTIAQAAAAKAAADARRAEIEAATAATERATTPDPNMTRIRKELQTDSVLERINQARGQIGEGWSTGNVAGQTWFQGLPGIGQNSTNLNATLTGLQGAIINDTVAALKEMSTTGATGFGSLTETEAQRLAAAVASLNQAQGADELRTGLALVERHYRNALALLNNEDPREPAVAEKYGVIPQRDDQTETAATGGTMTSEGKFEADPALRGVNGQVREMIANGRSPDQIRSYLDTIRPGLGAQVTDLDRAVAFARQNPNNPEGFNVDIEKVWKPNSGLTRTLGDIGMSPVGTGLIGAADTASMGFLDNLTSNPALTRATMEGVSEENPSSYLIGQLLGGATTGLGAEAALARGGLTGIRAARAGDAAYGAGYGAGMADDPEDSRVAAALLGAGGGVLGGAAGRGAARVAGRGLAGVQDAAQQTLHRAGVRMTPGQILGGGAKATEDRIAGLPVVGDMIQARRGEGIADFNTAAFNEALAPINQTTNGVTGGAGIEIARALRSDAYAEALDPVRVVSDPPFEADMQAVIARSLALPEPMRGHAQYTLPTRVGEAFDDTGGLSGTGYQQALRGLRRDTSSLESQPFGWDFAQVTRGAEGALEGLLERQSPGTVGSLRTANEVNRRVETLRDAVNRARNSGEVFRPSQLSDAAAVNARKYGNSQGTTQQPFYELARAGQEVLPSTIPDSGTAGRLVLPAIAGSLAGGGSYAAQDAGAESREGSSLGIAAVAAALAAAPYSRSSRDIIQRLLMSDRPDVVETAGQLLLENSNIAGILARQPTVEALR